MVEKCAICTVVVNRNGEHRPGIKCAECKKENCFKCAYLPNELCKMMRDSGKNFWKCKACESKEADLKSVLVSIQTEIVTIKKSQEDQKGEVKEVLDGLKRMEEVANKVDRIEEEQGRTSEQIRAQGETLRENTEKVAEACKRASDLEERLNEMDKEALNVRQTNAVVREIQEIEKRGKNLIFCKIPEASTEDTEDGKKQDEDTIKGLLRMLEAEEVKPVKVRRVGERGQLPRRILVQLESVADCEKVLHNSWETELPDEAFVTKDRTYNQRQEARRYRLEREKEERDGVAPQGRGRGGKRGPGRPQGARSGGPGRRPQSGYRKRKNTDGNDDTRPKRSNAGTGEDERAPAPSAPERHGDAGAASLERGADAPGTSTSYAPPILTLTTREDGVFVPL